VKQWIKEHADLSNHDGDYDAISLLVGVYNEYTSQEDTLADTSAPDPQPSDRERRLREALADAEDYIDSFGSESDPATQSLLGRIRAALADTKEDTSQ
jgi:hypothetical protein